MLIEFKVSNFRSIQQVQTFSMVASKDSILKNNIMKRNSKLIPNLVQISVLYGPNASGKSNLLSAMNFMGNVVRHSTAQMQEGEKFLFQPFRFTEKILNEPSEFEIHFVVDDIRYQYGFALTVDRIVEEWLYAYPKAKGQEWFTRKFDKAKDDYKWDFGSHLTGQKQVWKEATRSNALFLSTAVNLNSEQLRPLYHWFTSQIGYINSAKDITPQFTTNLIKDEKYKKEVIDVLQAADFGINDIKIETLKGKVADLRMKNNVVSMEVSENVDIAQIKLIHSNKIKSDSVMFDIQEESHGTQRLYLYAGPIIEAIKNGRTLIIDELERGLHPLLVRFLINLFHNPEINTCNSQLIFSTHDTSLLDPDLFRRDQIWFVEKDQNYATQLYPLTDFSPRKKEAFEKGYLQGRYGALPFIGQLHIWDK